MFIGVLNESEKIENRVGLTPGGVSFLTGRGIQVSVQTGAGSRAGYSNEEYASQGAHIVFTAEEIFNRSDVVINISPLSDEECLLVKDGQILIGFHHLAVFDKNSLNLLLERGVTILGYEIIQKDSGVLPFIESLSEVAGQMCLFISGQYLQTVQGGRGILVGGVVTVPPATAVVVGSGVLARSAVRALIGAGAHTIALGRDMDNLRSLEEKTNGRLITLIANQYNLSRMIKVADILIGAVLEPGEKAPVFVTRDMVASMRKGSLVIDLAIDQGGCIETSRPTTLERPTYSEEGVIHYCVPNITSAVSRTSTKLLSNLATPILDGIKTRGLGPLLKEDESLACGVYIYRGQVVKKKIADLFGLPVKELASLL
ncbi:MAG: alanine dehydrogenase [Acidobacteriota bacterium]